MSAATESDESDTIMQRCASCGIAGGDDITLKKCTACHLVRYCGVKCQRDHWPTHKKECKKRAAELRDEILFKQQEGTYLGDCPICCLPVPIDPGKSTLYACCSKVICNGCDHANKMREIEGRLEQKCPFCRTRLPKTQDESNERLLKRVESNDPFAMRHLGMEGHAEGDYGTAFEYWTKAAALGDAKAHFQLSTLYGEGKGVEKDDRKFLHHTEQAAIRGHPIARHNLGWVEVYNGRVDRAVKHWIIAAKLGYDESLEAVKNRYKDGIVSKEDFTAALRGYQTAIEATKSPQREAAYEFTT